MTRIAAFPKDLGLPTAWDETVVPSAEVARHVVVARRSGGR